MQFRNEKCTYHNCETKLGKVGSTSSFDVVQVKKDGENSDTFLTGRVVANIIVVPEEVIAHVRSWVTGVNDEQRR
jgi:hypothetical protein